MIEDFRFVQGQRYTLACYLTIAVAARRAGYRGVCAFAECADYLDDDSKIAIGAFWSPTYDRWTLSAGSRFRHVFSNIPQIR